MRVLPMRNPCGKPCGTRAVDAACQPKKPCQTASSAARASDKVDKQMHGPPAASPPEPDDAGVFTPFMLSDN